MPFSCSLEQQFGARFSVLNVRNWTRPCRKEKLVAALEVLSEGLPHSFENQV
jgi:hypothetical protein